MEATHRKGKAVASSSSEIACREVVEFESLWYEGDEWDERKQVTARRGLEPGRLVDLECFSEKRNFKVHMMVERLNLTGLLVFEKHERRIYTDEVRQFYTYLHEVGQGEFRSMVNGRILQFDAGLLEVALRIGGKGVEGNFDKERAKRVLGLGNSRKSSSLEVDMHIMHYIMTFNILPISGHRDAISADHLEMLFYLHEGILPRIGFWILRYMMNAIGHKQRNLPYGILLTRLFHHFNVPLEDREWDYVRSAWINGLSLSFIGIVPDPGQRKCWIYAERPFGPRSTRVTRNSEESVHADISSESVYSLSVEMERLNTGFGELVEDTSACQTQLFSEMDLFGEHIQQQLNSVRAECSDLREVVQDIHHQQHRINTYLEAFLSEFKNG